ncbi:MAG: hypothetical protein QG665_182 [Patescibacteria group bacterium]|nr:hypothetical protein [Patescibacteria group bacterium]
MKNKKLLAYVFLPALALGLAGTGVASAQGMGMGLKNIDPKEAASHLEERFAHQAEVFGLNVSDVKEAWADGKTIKELAEEKGIDLEAVKTKMKAERKEQMKEHLQSLVSEGVITQDQANKRLAWMEKMADKMKDKVGNEKEGGFRMGGGPMMGGF